MSSDEPIIERLDLIVGVLQLAHHDAIEGARRATRDDAVNAAILDGCADDWTPAKALHAHVMAAVPWTTPRTVQRRTSELVARRALKQRGTTNTKAYRSTGLI